jgi:hypothetical protein
MKFVSEVNPDAKEEDFINALKALDKTGESEHDMSLELLLAFSEFTNFVGMMADFKKKRAEQ